jgi:hypothetical protein
VDKDVGNLTVDDGFAETIRYYGLWREIANFVGSGPYEEADWEDGRLYFRLDYWDKLREWPEWAQLGDWAAWIIAPTGAGYFCVMHSLKHERASQRSERIEVIFSHVPDAGKYIILQMGDSLRYRLGLETLSIKWRAQELNSRIQIAPAGREIIDFLIKERPTLEREYAVKHLKNYTLEHDASAYGFALPADQTNMEVLALSFEELTTALLDGMPESITSKVPAWRH